MKYQDDSSQSAQFDFWANALAASFLALAIFRFWLAPLPSSYWLDETGTAWAVKDGLRQMLARIQEWPTITPLYGLFVLAASAIGGTREYVLRLPSLLAVMGATVFVYLIASRLMNRTCAYSSVVLFICSDMVIFAATDARPYGMVLLAMTCSTYALIRWLDSGTFAAGLAYVFTAAAIPHLNIFSPLVLIAHALYIYKRMQTDARVRIGQVIVCVAAVILLTIHLVPAILQLFHSRGVYSFADRPSFYDFAEVMFPPVMMLGLGAGYLTARLFKGGFEHCAVKLDSAGLWLACGFFTPVLVLFVLSRAGSNSMFVPRYMIASQVGFALLGGCLIGTITSSGVRAVVNTCVIVCALFASDNLSHFWPRHAGEDWRGAIATARAAVQKRDMPVLIQSGFVEASAERFDFAQPLPTYLLAPLVVYGTPGKGIVLPYRLDAAAQRYLETSVVPLLQKSDSFLLITRGTSSSYVNWLAVKLGLSDIRPLGNFGAVEVIECKNSGPIAATSQSR